MLDKLCTYRAAVAAGVPTPRFWAVASADDVAALGGELVYPLIVKPRRSHVFEARFGRKFFVPESFQETVDAVTVALEAGSEVLLMELIPGADDQLSSYYTYLDDVGQPLFEFTKRIIRRHPVNMGPATYHVTDLIPALRDPALALFRQVGLCGVANVEFKLDPRDGTLRLIECNGTVHGFERAARPGRFRSRPMGLPSHSWRPSADARELSPPGSISGVRRRTSRHSWDSTQPVSLDGSPGSEGYYTGRPFLFGIGGIRCPVSSPTGG